MKIKYRLNNTLVELLITMPHESILNEVILNQGLSINLQPSLPPVNPIVIIPMLEYNPVNYLQWIISTVEYLSHSSMIYLPYYDVAKEKIYNNILLSAPTKHYYRFELINGAAYITYACNQFYIRESFTELTDIYHSAERKEQKILGQCPVNIIINSEIHITQFANVYYIQYDLSGRIDKYL